MWPNFGKILPKVAEKGSKNIFERSSFFNSIDTLTETKKNSIKFRIDPIRVNIELAFLLNSPSFFQNWPNFFDVLAGKQFRDLATRRKGGYVNGLILQTNAAHHTKMKQWTRFNKDACSAWYSYNYKFFATTYQPVFSCCSAPTPHHSTMI